MDYNGFASYGYDSHFLTQKPPVPPPMAKVSASNYGWPVTTPGMPSMSQLGGQWVSIPEYVNPNNGGGASSTGSFPKKGRPGVGFGGGKTGQKRPYQPPKPFDPTGKTPAMLLHELFKEITEKYEEVPINQTKRYKCVLSINGQEFSMQATSKKVAKQKASEQVIRALRPDIPVLPFEETITQSQVKKPEPPKAQPQPQMAPNPYAAFVQSQQNPPYGPVVIPPPPPPMIIVPVKKSGPPSKRAKLQLPAVDTALSLVDAVRKLCVERIASGPYNPIFEFEETSDAAVTDKLKKKYICILSFPEKNIKYTAEGIGRNTPKDIVCLKALKEEFGVTDSQIKAIMRRNVMGKGEMPIVQTLHHVASLCHCTVSFKTEPVEPGIGIGTGRHLGFTCELTLTDHTLNDKVVVLKSDMAPSKHDAKENVCRKMLKHHFEIDPEAQRSQPPQAIPPCQQLQVYCAKRFKRNDSLKFEDLGTVGVRDHNSFGFKFKCVVEGREFYGMGPSKKEAKNAAATEALRIVFGNGQVKETSPECYDLTEYVKREHHSLCMKHGIEDIPTQFAAFVFLNSENNKRMASLAAVVPGPIPGQTVLDSNGTVLHMMDPIVLARRGLVRYLLTEMINFDPASETNILEQGPDGLFNLKNNIRLTLYSTYAPGVYHSRPMSEKLSLTTLGHRRELVGSESQTVDEIRSTGFLKCFSPADKIFKWTHIGVQGALLTTLMHPVVLDTIYFGTPHPEFTDEDLKFSFFSRLCPPTRDVKVESVKRQMHDNFPRNMKYVYLRDKGDMEYLRDDGVRIDDLPSDVCKASLYSLYLQANPSVSRDTRYLTAKARAVDYNHNKRLLYEQLERRGYGIWHSKPAELSDFILDDPLEDIKADAKTEETMLNQTVGSMSNSQIDFSADL